MTTIRRFFAEHAFACLGVGVFVACVAFAFEPVFPKYVALLSADSGPFFGIAHRTEVLEGYLTGTAFAPQQLYWLLLPPLYAHELTYVIDSLVLTLAGVYYLRGRRVHPLAAWLGGVALGLSGYTFTLFCAGHRGYFHMFSSTVWSFGLLIRCFETRRLFYFAALGLVFAWGGAYQPDVMVLVGLVAAAYALKLTLAETPGEGVREVFARMARVWPRFIVSVLFLALAGSGALKAAVTTQVANREAQMSQSPGSPAASDKKGAGPTAAERHSRWIFATNWSLPPEDMLEFVAPGVFGNDSMQPPYPYWGRLGRAADEAFQKGRMMPNYRQHTVYLGVVSVLFALFGLMAWAVERRNGKGPGLDRSAADYSDVPFWCGVWLFCLILAMGRYTPLYRLFYAIPYMEYVRAPVKFHHLVEVATAFLAGFGMNAFLRAESVELRRRWAGASAAAAVLLALAALMAVVSKPQMVRHIAELGLKPVADALGDYAAFNLIRAFGLAAAVCAAVFASRKWAVPKRMWVGAALFAAMACDLASVASRYVRPLNVEPFYQPNAVVRAVNKAANGQSPVAINYVTPNAFSQDWFSSSLEINGIRNMAPAPDDRDSPLARLFPALQGNPVRLWQICHAQYVVVPRRACETLLRAGVVSDALDFDLGPGVVRPAASVGEKTLTLARVRDASAGPRFVATWEGGVAPDRQVDALVASNRDVSDAPAPGVQQPAGAAERVQLLSSRGLPGVFSTRIRTEAKQPGLLVFDERKTDRLEVLVDGRPQAVYTADALWPAVLLPEGSHEVVLRQRRNLLVPLASLVGAVIVAGWGWLNLRAARGAVAG